MALAVAHHHHLAHHLAHHAARHGHSLLLVAAVIVVIVLSAFAMHLVTRGGKNERSYRPAQGFVTSRMPEESTPAAPAGPAADGTSDVPSREGDEPGNDLPR